MTDNPAKEVNTKSLFEEDPEQLLVSKEKRAALVSHFREQRRKFMQLEDEKAAKRRAKNTVDKNVPVEERTFAS